jgi:hypothetical protein
MLEIDCLRRRRWVDNKVLDRGRLRGDDPGGPIYDPKLIGDEK